MRPDRRPAAERGSNASRARAAFKLQPPPVDDALETAACEWKREAIVVGASAPRLHRSILLGFAIVVLLAALSVFLEFRNTHRIRESLDASIRGTVNATLGAAQLTRDIRDLDVDLQVLIGESRVSTLDRSERRDAAQDADAARDDISRVLNALHADLAFARRQTKRLLRADDALRPDDPRVNVLEAVEFYLNQLDAQVAPLTSLSSAELLKTAAYVEGVVEPNLERLSRAIDRFSQDAASALKERSIATTTEALNDVNSLAVVSAVAVATVALVLGLLIARARKKSEALLTESELKFRSLVQNASDVIVVLERDASIAYVSPAVHPVMGFTPEELQGVSALEHVHPDDVHSVTARLKELVMSPGASTSMELRVRHSDGSWRWVEALGSNLLEASGIEGIVVNYRDVTDRKALEEELTRQAFHDSLTGLSNRALFRDRVAHALTQQQRSEQALAVALLDLDDFKIVNDSLGHGAGDELLIAVAERLRHCLRSGDTAARLGGDEFALLLEGLTSGEEAAAIAERVLGALQDNFVIDGREVSISGSLGISIARGSASNVEQLLREADVAMYQAKNRGKHRHEIFHSGMQLQALERLELKVELQRALDEKQFLLYFQPLVSLDRQMIVGCEALIRWNHPSRGLLSPNTFVPLAEETGIIVDIGRWVLLRACDEARRWQEHHAVERLAIAVNISPRQFEHPRFVRDVADALEQTGLSPGLLTLEITEGLLVEDTTKTISRLEELKALGVRLAIDDFGTGYSSLAYLQRFPIDELKIDKRFVDGVAQGVEDAALAQAVIRLSDSLRMKTVAEGIESPQQVAQLKEWGCEFGQGYHFSKPLPGDQFEALLSRVDVGTGSLWATSLRADPAGDEGTGPTQHVTAP